MVTLIEDGDGVPVVDEGGQLPQAVLCHQGQVVDAYQPIVKYIIYNKKDKDTVSQDSWHKFYGDEWFLGTGFCYLSNDS